MTGDIDRFLEWLNATDGTDPVIQAAIAHLRFVTVHPFEDGNGRIARAISDMLMARADGTTQRCYSMSSRIMQERSEYHRALEDAQKYDGDATGWLIWFTECLGRAIDHAGEELATVRTKARFWNKTAHMTLNERQRSVVNRMLDGFEGKLTTTKWARLTKTSRNTATRDINGLMGRGILLRGEGRGRSTHYVLAEEEER